MENKKTPEILKPEQMELRNYKHLDWVIIYTEQSKWLIKIDYITDENIHDLLDYNITERKSYSNKIPLGIKEVLSIRHATKEEVLKYFPDEVFENVSLINEVNNSQVPEQQKKIESEKVELRPKDLVSGEVYTAFDEEIKRTFIFDYLSNFVFYKKMLNYDGRIMENKKISIFHKFYHATPEEKKLLLGEEQTDLEYWKKRAESATKGLEGLQKDYNELDEKYNQSEKDYYKVHQESVELLVKYNELNSKYDKQLEVDFELSAFYDNLQITYSDLMGKYEELNNENEFLRSDSVRISENFNTLQSRYETLVNEANKLDCLSGEMCDKYTKLKDNYEKLSAYNDELTNVINEQSNIITTLRNEIKEKESKEKVYFYFSNDTDQYMHRNTIDKALVLSCDDMDIYEAVKIGYKKSVLVSE